MEEFLKALNSAIASLHPMRGINNHDFRYVGVFPFNNKVYAYMSGYINNKETGRIDFVITVRRVDKVNNESNMGANEEYLLAYEEDSHIPKAIKHY